MNLPERILRSPRSPNRPTPTTTPPLRCCNDQLKPLSGKAGQAPRVLEFIRYAVVPTALYGTTVTIFTLVASLVAPRLLALFVSQIGPNSPFLLWAYSVAGVAALSLLLPPLVLTSGFVSLSEGANSGAWKEALSFLSILLVAETMLRRHLPRAQSSIT